MSLADLGPPGASVQGDHPLDRTPEGELLRRLLVVLDKHGITDFDCPDSLDALLTSREEEVERQIRSMKKALGTIERIWNETCRVLSEAGLSDWELVEDLADLLADKLGQRDTKPEKSDGGPSYEAAVQKVLEEGCDVLGGRAVAVAVDPAGRYAPPSKTARRFVQNERAQEFKALRFEIVVALLMYYLEHTDPDDVRDSAGTMRALLVRAWPFCFTGDDTPVFYRQGE